MVMRKDFILSEEEKQRRKKRVEENRNTSSTSYSVSNSQTFDPIDSVSVYVLI